MGKYANGEGMMRRSEVVVVGTVGIVVGAVGVAWVLVSMLPIWAIKVGLIVLLGLGPVAFGVGWQLGSRDARAFMSGVDRGTGAVIKAGDQVADLRREKVTRARQAVVPPEVKLPDATRLEIVRGHPGQGEEVVEL